MSAAPILTILKDGETIRSCPLEGDAVVGRGEGCVIRLEDRAISREHALIRRVGDALQVEKKSKFAPLVVNGAECTTAILREGDVISIGPYLLRLSGEKNGVPKAAPSTLAPEPRPSAAPVLFQPVPQLADENGDAGMGGFAVSGMDSSPGDLGDVTKAPLPESGEGALAGGAPEDGFGLDLPGSDATGEPEDVVVNLDGTGGEAATGTETQATGMVTSGGLQARLVFKPGEANISELALDKEEILIGRGKDCDVVLNDKQCSRRNSAILREGARFTIRDLQSVNGTFVNDERVTEQELAGNDRIRVGEIEFRFEAFQSRFEEKLAGQGLDASSSGSTAFTGDTSTDGPAELEMGNLPGPPGSDFPSELPPPPPMEGDGSGGGGLSPGSGGIPGLGGIPGIGGEAGKAKGNGLLDRFRRQSKLSQILIIILVVGGLYYLLNDDEDAGPKTVKGKKTQTVATAGSGVTAGSGAAVPLNGQSAFAALTPDQKRFVEAEHELAFNYYRNRQYDEALNELQKIFAIVPDYKDSREIERYAKEGKRKLEALADEKRKHDQEEELKQKVATALTQARGLMAKKKYEEASVLFPQILALDPENAEVAGWKHEIQQHDEDEQIEAKKRAVLAEIRKEAREAFDQAMELKRDGKYHEAIHAFEHVTAMDATDPKLSRRARGEIAATRALIQRKLTPLLASGKQSEDGGDYAAARKSYEKALAIEPESADAQDGIDRVQGILHEKAKTLYVEAVLAESFSDFTTAHRKFEDCLNMAPPDDPYHQRAQRKLSRYFKREDISAQ